VVYGGKGGTTVAKKSPPQRRPHAKKAKNATKSANKSANNVRPLIWISLAVIGLLVLVVVINQVLQGQAAQPVEYSEPPSLDGQPVLGNSDAPVTVVEFGDYKCPSCKVWTERIFPRLKEDYIDKGKVRFAFINVLFHGEESKLASLAAETVFAMNAEAFWTYHHALFEAQPPSHDDRWVTKEKLAELAEKHVPDMNLERFKEELDRETALPAVETDMALVDKFQVELTPSVMINTVMLPDPFDYEAIQAMIEQQLEAAK
jgi:protein-disulfide isomerase